MREALYQWWLTNRGLVGGTLAVAVTLGIAFGLWDGPGSGALVAFSILAVLGVLMLSSATFSGMDVTLDRQIAMRERDAARKQRARDEKARAEAAGREAL